MLAVLVLSSADVLARGSSFATLSYAYNISHTGIANGIARKVSVDSKTERSCRALPNASKHIVAILNVHVSGCGGTSFCQWAVNNNERVPFNGPRDSRVLRKLKLHDPSWGFYQQNCNPVFEDALHLWYGNFTDQTNRASVNGLTYFANEWFLPYSISTKFAVVFAMRDPAQLSQKRFFNTRTYLSQGTSSYKMWLLNKSIANPVVRQLCTCTLSKRCALRKSWTWRFWKAETRTPVSKEYVTCSLSKISTFDIVVDTKDISRAAKAIALKLGWNKGDAPRLNKAKWQSRFKLGHSLLSKTTNWADYILYEEVKKRSACLVEE